MSNFERHYNTSKAPFGVYLTANGWFQEAEFRLEGYKRFLDVISTKDDVYIVPIARVRKWFRNTFSRDITVCITVCINFLLA